MKKVILGAVSALAISSSAFAADIYRGEAVSMKDAPVYVAPHIWTGFYVGANVGYGWSAEDSAELTVDGTGPLYPLTAKYSTDFEGVFGGGLIGYNIQRGRVVFGIEADIQAADFTETYSAVNPFSLPNIVPSGTASLNTKLDIDWLGTLRARLGVASGNTLIYATGGLAFGEVDLEGLYANFSQVPFGAEDTNTGFALGAGIEHALGGNWSLKAEYLYVDLGDIKARTVTVDEVYETEADVAFHAVRVGLNYKLGSKHEPLK